jgi:hypothetical protein
MTPNRQYILDQLASDAELRGKLVEVLRASSAILDGTSPWGAELDEQVGHQFARQLRDLAQRFCDHARTSRDGTCRYCDVLLNCEES